MRHSDSHKKWCARAGASALLQRMQAATAELQAMDATLDVLLSDLEDESSASAIAHALHEGSTGAAGPPRGSTRDTPGTRATPAAAGGTAGGTGTAVGNLGTGNENDFGGGGGGGDRGAAMAAVDDAGANNTGTHGYYAQGAVYAQGSGNTGRGWSPAGSEHGASPLRALPNGRYSDDAEASRVHTPLHEVCTLFLYRITSRYI